MGMAGGVVAPGGEEDEEEKEAEEELRWKGRRWEWTDGIRKSREEIALVLGSGSQGLSSAKAKRSERQGRKARQAGPGETWKWRG